jgi:hypothetical protein
MDGADSEEPVGPRAAQDPDGSFATGGTEAHAEADRAAAGLRDQIAALRRRVKDAQDTLREHHRRATETRSFRR